MGMGVDPNLLSALLMLMHGKAMTQTPPNVGRVDRDIDALTDKLRLRMLYGGPSVGWHSETELAGGGVSKAAHYNAVKRKATMDAGEKNQKKMAQSRYERNTGK